jgi:hypothetical protein
LGSAHCFINSLKNRSKVYYDFEGGQSYLYNGKSMPVRQFLIYQPYRSSPTPENDFALIFIRNPLVFNSDVGKVDLATINVCNLEPSFWSKCQLSGEYLIYKYIL